MAKKLKTKKVKTKQMLSDMIFILKIVSKASPTRLFFQILISIIYAAYDVLYSVVFFKFVVQSIEFGKTFDEIVLIVALFVLFGIIIDLSSTLFWNIYLPLISLKTTTAIRSILFKKASEVDNECFENPEFYEKYIKANELAVEKVDVIIHAIGNMAGYLVSIITVSLVVFEIDPFLSIFIIVPVLTEFFLGRKLNKIKVEYTEKETKTARKREYVKRVFYLADYAKELRLTKAYTLLLRDFKDSLNLSVNLIRKYGMSMYALNVLLYLVQEILSYLAVLAYVSVKTLVVRVMALGDCFVVINSITSVTNAVKRIIERYLELEENTRYIHFLREFLSYKIKIDSNEDGEHIYNKCDKIELKNVSFTYDGANTPSLKNINLTIPSGEKVAFVGINGAGKSTLAKLLMRLYDVSEGEILLGGTNIKNFVLKEYRNYFGFVFQDYKIAALSVGENVLMRPAKQGDREIVENSLKKSGAYDRVMQMKDNIDTLLTREFDYDGVVLSGGESQKIAIARVFAKDCKIIVFDEPTSALDPIAEYNIYKNIMKEFNGKTVVFISHRLSSAVLADKIYMFENGEIIEEGSHGDLMQKNGKYADMFNKQAEKYIESKVEI